jgi:hypothetical protein
MDTNGNGLNGDHTFSFTTGTLDCGHIEDYFEPNDDIASATPVEFGTEYRMLTSCGDAERKDFFKFTLTETKKVTARADVFYSDVWPLQYLFAFYDVDGHEYTSAGSQREAPGIYSWRYAFLPGTYYVEVGNYHVDAALSAYNLTLVTSEACQDDQYEDNDFYDQAVPVTPDILLEDLRACASDADWFAVDLVAGQTLTVTMTEEAPSNNTRRINIFKSSAQSVRQVQGTANPMVLTFEATEDITYAVRVYWWVDDITYDLNLEVAGP